MDSLVKHTLFKGDSYEFEVNLPIAEIPTISGYTVVVNFSGRIDTIDNGPFLVLTSGSSQLVVEDVGEMSKITVRVLPENTATLPFTSIYYKVKLTKPSVVKTVSVGVIEFQSVMGDYYLKRFRKFLKDSPINNTGEFLDTIENTDDDLRMYLNMAVESYNDSFFRTDFTIDFFKNEMLLFTGALLSALVSNGVVSARCALTYQDMGGIVVQDMDRYGRYLQMFNQFFSYWKSHVLDTKRAWNINNAYGEVHSDMIWGGFEQNSAIPLHGRNYL